uniref:Dedicator of cytokinesis protein 4 n=1 Tax=Sphaerodactylus townsendi TaxID=933632 RepID=A0ACB8FPZ4_9SAUR
MLSSRIPLFGPYPSLLKKIERETWRESGVSLIATVTRLMERLLDYRDCMKMGDVDGKKIGCTVSLLNHVSHHNVAFRNELSEVGSLAFSWIHHYL